MLLRSKHQNLLKSIFYTLLHVPVAAVVLIVFGYLVYPCVSPELALFVLVGLAYVLSLVSRSYKRAFTISIFLGGIAVVSIVVLASMFNQTRSMAPASAIMSALKETQLQAELVYHNNGDSYELICVDETINMLLGDVSELAKRVEWRNCEGKLLQYIRSRSSEPMPSTACTTSKDGYQVKVYIPAYDLYWSVDSMGKTEFPNPTGEVTAIPWYTK